MSAATVSSRRSWASIVSGSSDLEVNGQKVNAPIQPAARGERKSLCHGELLVMLGHYGWIMSLDDIDHPDAGKNGGRIYVNKRDVIADDGPLTAGDRVLFYLYADQQGLGAEACQLKKPEPASLIDGPDFGPSLAESLLSKSEYWPRCDKEDSAPFAYQDSGSSWNLLAEEYKPNAADFPMNVGAAAWGLKAVSMNPSVVEFKPRAPCMNANAAEFVPKDMGMNPGAVEFVPKAWNPDAETFLPPSSAQLSNAEVLAINLAYLSDSSDDEDSTHGDDDASSEAESFVESEGSWADDFATKGANRWDSHLEAVVLNVPLQGSNSASKRALSPEGSTSAGSSGSDSDEMGGRLAVARPLFPSGFRPPPGLELPAPPGL